MATAEQPITRSELREELDRTLRYYATKEDLKDLKVDIIKWMLGIQGSTLVIIVTVVAVIVRLLA